MGFRFDLSEYFMTPEETELINKFRSLSDEDKKKVIALFEEADVRPGKRDDAEDIRPLPGKVNDGLSSSFILDSFPKRER